MQTKLTRRHLLGGIGAVAGGAVVGNSTGAATQPLDFAKPADNLTAQVKLLGTLDGGAVHYWYSGTIFGITPDDSVPLVGYAGLVKGVWSKWGDDSYLYRLFDNGYYADLKTGEPLEEIENPYTGKINRPVHFLGGPFASVKKPALLDWVRCGDDIWFEQHIGSKFVNKLDPEEWPLASTGKTIRLRYVDSFRGQVSDLENPDIASAPCQLVVSHVAAWMPFLLMGQQPGHTFWHAQGKKIFDMAEVPEVTMRYLQATMPEYIDATEPWENRTDSYLEYKLQRQPVKP